MRKKITLGATITLMAVTATVVFSVAWVFAMQVFNKQVYGVSERAAMYEKLAEVDNIVRQNFLFDIDEKSLTDSISAGYVAGLNNPYSYYMTAEEYKASTTSLDGKMTGIGIRPSKESNGFILVKEVFPGSPAADVGLQPGDLITQIGELSLNIDNQDEAISNLKNGEDGSTTNITYRRDNQDHPIEITRKTMDEITVYSKMIDDVALIKILKFNTNTAEQFESAVNSMISQGATGFIFDLRNNPGGEKNSIETVLNRLLPEGHIATAKYKNGDTDVIAKSKGENELQSPMVVLVNKNTASAAELFTIALRDYNKAQIVGTTTYGKGTMQTIQKLNDGSAISLTTAKYNPPVSENFDGKGIIPDVEITTYAEEEETLSKMVFDEINQYSDAQLKKAIDKLNSIKREKGMPISTEETVETPASSSTDAPAIDSGAAETPAATDAATPEQAAADAPKEEAPATDETSAAANGSAGDIKTNMSLIEITQSISTLLNKEVVGTPQLIMMNDNISIYKDLFLSM